MAADFTAKSLSDKERPFHACFLDKKLLCPHENCANSSSSYSCDGLDHHFRTIHKRPVTKDEELKAKKILQEKHAQETLHSLKELSAEFRTKMGGDGHEFKVQHKEHSLSICSNNAENAAKMFGVYLYHKGCLFPYQKGSSPRVIVVESLSVFVKFNAWFHELSSGKVSIVVESFYSKLKYVPDRTTPLQETIVPTAMNVNSLEDSDDMPLYVLKNVFQLQEFRPKQREAIQSITEGKDSLILLPTGSGKTICYAIPALIMSGVTVVITPLLALLSDQVNKLRSKGITACYIRSSMSAEEKESVLHELSQKDNCYKLFHITPETATSEPMKKHFQEMKNAGILGRFIIDEAHCIDTWGSTFRPAYAQLGCLRTLGIPFHAFTGTATSRTQTVIVASLHMTDPIIVKLPSERNNLFFKVTSKKDQKAKDDIVKLIQEEYKNQCGIVYCSTRRDTKDMAYLLKVQWISAVYYDGALDDMEKEHNSRAWLEGRALVICATKAFGMGIDKKDVRFVIHLTFPESMEDYFQEAGRAGRDGLPSTCILFYRFEDRCKILNSITSTADPNQRSRQKLLLDSMVRYCMLNDCRRTFILSYFDENCDLLQPCGNACDNCRNPRQSVPSDYTDLSVQAFNCVLSMSIQGKVTLKQAAFTLKGSKSKKDVLNKNYHLVPQYGLGKSKLKSEGHAIRYFQLLVINGFLEENMRDVAENTSAPFLTLTEKAYLIKNDLGKVILNL